MKIKRDVILAPYSTFKIGGPAKFFVEVKNTAELEYTLKFARKSKIPIFILGSGSNLLISDEGYNGLVIKIAIKNLEFRNKGYFVLVRVGAGENWDSVVNKAVKLKLWGIENLSLIPGTTGAAVYQNIGAYGCEIKDVLRSVEVFDIKKNRLAKLSNKDCQFQYRDSIFKHGKKNTFIITKVCLKLNKNSKPNLKYLDLLSYFKFKNPTIAQVRKAVIKIRKSKLPYPDEFPNAGSFFKNPVVALKKFKQLKVNFLDLRGRNVGHGKTKLSAAQLIEKCGWKGRRVGNVGVSNKHSLVLVNYGNGSSKKIFDLSEKIKSDVKNKFGLTLEREVEMV